MLTHCSDCNFYNTNENWCQQFNLHTKSTDGCPIHSSNIINCSKCGGPLHRSHAVATPDGRILCEKCSHSSCNTCKYSQCAFLEDKTLPDTIIETKQNGPMTIQQQVMNPEKIRKHCLSCRCFSEEFGCFKQYHCCDKYENVIG